MLTVGAYCVTKVVPISVNGTGVVMEVLPYDQFVVRINCPQRLTRRNIRFLKLYNPVSTNIESKVFND